MDTAEDQVIESEEQQLEDSPQESEEAQAEEEVVEDEVESEVEDEDPQEEPEVEEPKISRRAEKRIEQLKIKSLIANLKQSNPQTPHHTSATRVPIPPKYSRNLRKCF